MTDRPSPWTTRRIAIALGGLALLAVLLTIDGPGITIDEPLDVRPGRNYVATLRAKGWGFLGRDVRNTIYLDNREHPPLGRWLLGVASTLGEPVEILLRGGPDPTGSYVVAGRVAPALVFACLVALVAAEAGRRWGRPAGLVAGFALLVMPRAFAHAHLGALDTFIAAAWTLALLVAVRATESRRPTLAMAGAGLVWCLALLTKIQAWFVAPVVLAWAVARLGPKRATLPVLVWTAVGLAGFVLGWPWLWDDPIGRGLAYLGTGVERVSIRVLYFGTVYADRDVPWHYPWVYFAITVPVGLHLLGGWGVVASIKDRRADRFPLLLIGAILLFLVLFSTRVPVYDGERLFLAAFPLWALLIGRGFAAAWERWPTRTPRRALTGLVLAQAVGVVLVHPFGLSYHNALVGGLPGAERLGLELTFWNDAVSRRLLRDLQASAQSGETAALVPTLAPQQGVFSTTLGLALKKVVLKDQEAATNSDWLIVSRREAYWPDPVRTLIHRGEVVAEQARQGVWLSRVIRLRKAKTP